MIEFLEWVAGLCNYGVLGLALGIVDLKIGEGMEEVMWPFRSWN